MQFTELNLPYYPFQITEENNKVYIFDEIRKKRIRLTPEEWVRQHFVQYLINHLHYPKSWIQLESGIKLHGLPKRADIVVFNTETKPHLLVECKAPTIKITNAVFEQAVRYNFVYQVNYMVLTNGLEHFCCILNYENHSYDFISTIPEFK